MPHPPLRRLLTVAGATAVIAATSGFSFIVPINDPSATQQTPLSPIRFAQLGCVPGAKSLNGEPITTPCGPFSAMFVSGPGATVEFTSPGKYRLLVAYALPVGFTPPPIRMEDHPEVTFEVDPNVVDDQRLDPLDGVGEWVGYRSSVIAMPVGSAMAGGRFYADVPVPRGDDGAPDPTMRGTAIALGAQVIADGIGNTYPDRPVDCDESLDPTVVPSYISSIRCPEGGGQWTQTFPTDADVVAPTATATVDAGASTTLSFRVRQAGSIGWGDEASPIALDASATIAGASATPGRTTLAWDLAPQPPRPSAGAQRSSSPRRPNPVARTTDVPVTVSVPATTPTGDYDVTLRGSDPGGERTATARIHVVGAPVVDGPTKTEIPPTTVPPVVTPPVLNPAPAPAGRAARVQLVRRITVGSSRLLHAGRVSCRTSGACHVATVVEIGGRRVATGSVTVKSGASQRVRLRLSASAFRRLHQRTGTIRVTATSPNAPTVTRTLKFRAR